MLYPKEFNFQTTVTWFKDQETLWTYALLFYLPVCQILERFYNPNNRYMLKKIGFVWNVTLSLFSAVGTYMTLPYLVKCLYTEGLESILHISNPDCNYILNGKVAFWCTLFVCSKIPEFIDTFLYVLKNGKQHIFLHWYHHLFTAFYSYYMVVREDLPSKYGIWMASLNFFVHTIMYAYYAVMEITEQGCWLRKLVNKYAIFITIIQTVQMFVVMYVMLYDKFMLGNNIDHFGLGMYLVYAVLFTNLFVGKYLTKSKSLKSE
jgi:elongation of very long chain fatty acids protein 6